MNAVWVTTSFEGVHRWPEAPPLVDFLRNFHRHVFYVKVTVLVSHNDRDVEFFTLKMHVDLVIKQITDNDFNLGRSSCEDMAKSIFTALSVIHEDQKPMYNVWSVEVSEDNENGAIVYKDDQSC
ncbi:MAG TPA: hypothetical protein PLI14_06560 [Bacilli bacterium]|jgi:6-pyruvoyl-tetrahydropterin synthase|nr:hypothetical protein [Bacilli bacterium]